MFSEQLHIKVHRMAIQYQIGYTHCSSSQKRWEGEIMCRLQVTINSSHKPQKFAGEGWAQTHLWRQQAKWPCRQDKVLWNLLHTMSYQQNSKYCDLPDIHTTATCTTETYCIWSSPRSTVSSRWVRPRAPYAFPFMATALKIYPERQSSHFPEHSIEDLTIMV